MDIEFAPTINSRVAVNNEQRAFSLAADSLRVDFFSDVPVLIFSYLNMELLSWSLEVGIGQRIIRVLVDIWGTVFRLD